MRVLAVDTALKACSVALIYGETVLARATEIMDRGHAERIAPMTREVMDSAGARLASLDRIVVTTGPGSFTGVRVGLAFARSLALALERPCVGLSTLEALALELGQEGLCAGAIDAPGGAYFAAYDDGRVAFVPARVEAQVVRDWLCGRPGASVRGPGAGAFGGEVVAAPDIVALARLGAARDPARSPPRPDYLRAPDAKLPPARTAS
jgi:tRNA threonylcarbamoyladenosine biosynthesis protein TsaB